jgi:hypothetical protein
MRVEGHAVYEETVANQLVTVWGEYGPGAARGYGIEASGNGGAGSA